MKYSIIKFSDTEWAIKVGRSSKGRFSYLTHTITTSEDDVKQECNYRNADDLLTQALKLVDNTTFADSMALAQKAAMVNDKHETRAADEDPDFDPMDARAYLS